MSLVRHFLTVGSNTMASRVLGFVREVLIAATLGAGPVADAFYAAFRFPNLFRRLFAEGAFNAAFIPLFSRALEENGQDGAKRFADEVLSVLFAVLILFTAIVEMTTPFLVATIIAPGFAADPEKVDLTIILSRIMFPYLAFMSLVAMFSGILNALHRYFVAAFAPVLLNIILISVLSFAIWKQVDASQVGLMLGIGVFVSGLAQLALLIIAVRKAGLKLRIGWPKLSPAVTRLLWLAAPAAIAGGITQINLFVGQIIASQKAGAISVLQYADRIYQLPLGVVGIAVGVVLLPELSRALKAGHQREAGHLQNRSLEFALFLTLPAAAALFVMPEPIVRILFERGAFTGTVTQSTSAVLALFALGLPAFVLVKVFSPGFFAREDTKTPMIIAAIAMGTNVVLSLALFPYLAEAGIALATSVAGWINAVLLAMLLYRRGHWPVERAALVRSGLMLACSLVMGLALYYLVGILQAQLGVEARFLTSAGTLACLVVAGAVLYFVLVALTGAAELKSLVGQIKRHKN